MRKAKEQKNKLSCSLVISIIFHVILLNFICFGSLDEIIKFTHVSSKDGEVVNAIMLDPSFLIEQYSQLQWQKNTTNKQTNAKQKKYNQQEEEFLKQQEKEQKRFKMLKADGIITVREGEIDKEQKQVKKAIQVVKEKNKIAKKETVFKAKAEQEQLIKGQEEAKEKVKKVATKALVVKKKIDEVKEAITINTLMSRLTSKQLTQKTGIAVEVKEAGQGENKKSMESSSSDVANYANKIKAAIESKFYDANIYHGKICELTIKLAPDGMLINITAKSNKENSQALCDTAIRAAKTATIPRAPSRSIYDAFNEQGSTLVFKP